MESPINGVSTIRTHQLSVGVTFPIASPHEDHQLQAGRGRVGYWLYHTPVAAGPHRATQFNPSPESRRKAWAGASWTGLGGWGEAKRADSKVWEPAILCNYTLTTSFSIGLRIAP